MRDRPPANLEVSTEQRDAATIVHITGDADVLGCEKLETALTPILAQKPHTLIFEMSKMMTITSLAMGKLLAAYRSVHNRGGKVILVSPIALVRDALHHARLDSVFPIVDSVDAAMRAD